MLWRLHQKPIVTMTSKNYLHPFGSASIESLVSSPDILTTSSHIFAPPSPQAQPDKSVINLPFPYPTVPLISQ